MDDLTNDFIADRLDGHADRLLQVAVLKDASDMDWAVAELTRMRARGCRGFSVPTKPANGFAIGHGQSHVDDVITDRRDGESLYKVLEEQVVPMYYDRDADGLPRHWIKFMMNSISTLAWRFSAHRMLMDYTRLCYVPAAGGLSSEMTIH